MPHPEKAIVTGAFSYTGGYIARHLLRQDVRVTTLTRHPDTRDSFGGAVKCAPLDFSDVDALSRSMKGASVFYNTYWIRFERGETSFDAAVENSEILFNAAKNAGIRKIVHISVSNPSLKSRLPYFKGKWQVEEALKNIGIPYAIIRPTLIFGPDDLLLNNIAWALRRFPVFPMYGNGDYPVQPIYAEDVAEQAVAAATVSENFVADAAGPDTFSFEELIGLLASAMGIRARFIHMPPSVSLALTSIVGLVVRDIVLTRDEVDGLMTGLLTSKTLPTGTTRFNDWLNENAHNLGRHYESELQRNFRL
ncbi:MAG: NAD(P)H-binding protein [Chloroflexi bacterium]|nr:NAD(P)H-binding protein [Chloroflexota bacterium]MYF78402.1 NAD(P)H-binding protein [Chloroflexota bacterium]MYK61024.1 NAD(P)H-binding protein [Chloroflexota bacterium]